MWHQGDVKPLVHRITYLMGTFKAFNFEVHFPILFTPQIFLLAQLIDEVIHKISTCMQEAIEWLLRFVDHVVLK